MSRGWGRTLALATAVLVLAAACSSDGETGSATVDGLDAAWVQAVDGGYEVRILVDGDCPTVTVGGSELEVVERAKPGGEFDATTCAAMLPGGATEILAGDQLLPTPVDAPQTVVIVGDTGCRLSDKHGQYQACDDPESWPFATIAESIATVNPDLIVHLGDYVYRESPCPDGNDGCAGSPSGQNLETWVTDYFEPSAPMRAAAPLVHIRGNHEDCSRGGEGWFRFFAPRVRPEDCADLTDPWFLDLGETRLGVMDTATVEDDEDNELLDAYNAQLALLSDELVGDSWVATHRPFWSVSMNDDGDGVAVNTPTLFDAAPQPDVGLLIGGHVHLAEVVELADGRPPQLVAGHGGTRLLDQFEDDLIGQPIAGTTISEGWQLYDFGFVVAEATESGWSLTFVDRDGAPVRNCDLDSDGLTCVLPT
jgi:predicted phosphodiesterase